MTLTLYSNGPEAGDPPVVVVYYSGDDTWTSAQQPIATKDDLHKTLKLTGNNAAAAANTSQNFTLQVDPPNWMWSSDLAAADRIITLGVANENTLGHYSQVIYSP